MMQSTQFFEKQRTHPQNQHPEKSTHTPNQPAETTIDYDNFSFQEYFDRSADQQYTASQQAIKPQQPPKNHSLQITQDLSHLLQTNLTVKQGQLERQGNGLLSSWEKRYCVLTQKQLFCYQNHLKQNLLSCINIRLLPCTVSQEYELIKIYYCVKSKPIVLRAANTDQALSWSRQLKNVIERHLTGKKIYLKKGNSTVYSQKNLISEQEFLSQAQSADILLMKTKQNSSCTLQRLVTNSEFDHVSLIIRFDNGEVRIFESNANEGVSLYSWAEFHSKFDFYQQITYRKLILEDKLHLQRQLVDFAKATLGMEYDIGAIKLIKQWSSQDKAARTYFCSELVAKAYKMMGLLDKEKASARYWPVDFTERGGVQLLRGAALGRQKTIVLAQHISRYE